MLKVAVFGNTGGGKSTLSKRLSELTGLPLYILDKIQFQAGGEPISVAEYARIHQQILTRDRWIIEGFGNIETLWPRLDAADTLIYIDLPLYLHFWWVTKRWLTGYITPPAGWPKGTPLFKSTLSSYRVLWLCDRMLTPKYRDYIARMRDNKTVYHLRSVGEIEQFFTHFECKRADDF